MAMALTGRNRHYEWNRMLYRHWLTTARQCRFPAEEMAAIIEDLMARLDEVIAQVAARLPATFPAAVAEPVFAGMRQAREQMTRSK